MYVTASAAGGGGGRESQASDNAGTERHHWREFSSYHSYFPHTHLQRRFYPATRQGRQPFVGAKLRTWDAVGRLKNYPKTNSKRFNLNDHRNAKTS